jgi:glutaredoxin
MTKTIQLYSTNDCPYCIELKGMLDKVSVPYKVIDVDDKENESEWELLGKEFNAEFVPTVLVIDNDTDDAKLFTPDIHFDEVVEAFDLIMKELR